MTYFYYFSDKLFFMIFGIIYLSILTYLLIFENKSHSSILLIFIAFIAYNSYLFDYFGKTPLWCLFVIFFSYISISIMLKQITITKIYKLFFLMLSLLLIYWVTVVFGKYYYENIFIVKEQYIKTIELIMQNKNLIINNNFYLSIIYFYIGLEKYFHISENIPSNNLQYFQYIIGFVFSGTLFSVIFDLVKDFLRLYDN